MAETESPVSVSLKLLIDTHAKRVLFAEAGKEFIDFLFRILSLPVGTLIRLLQNQETPVGSLSNLYRSIENLDESYMQPNQTKDALLNPVSPLVSGPVPLLALAGAPAPAPAPATKRFFRCVCSQLSLYVADDPRASCPNCNRNMSTTVAFVAGPGEKKAAAPAVAAAAAEGGFVKGVVTYMVMDDLSVTPLSTISSITLLNKFNVKEVGFLEEKLVSFGMDEAVKLLDASMRSQRVLTDVFLQGMIRIN